MKIYTLFYSAIALTVATSFSACNDLDEAERFIEEPLRVEDTNRNVLVEDFTGQDCNNCPKAHELIEGLQHQCNLSTQIQHSSNHTLLDQLDP